MLFTQSHNLKKVLLILCLFTTEAFSVDNPYDAPPPPIDKTPSKAAIVGSAFVAFILPILFIIALQKTLTTIEIGMLISKPDFPDYLVLNQDHQSIVERCCSCIENKIPLPGGGVFFYGPPGNGKTAIVNYIGYKSNAVIIPISPANICKSPFGNVPPNPTGALKQIFNIASTYYAATGTPVILFFDEVDFVSSRRDVALDLKTKSLTAQFLMEASAASEKEGVYLFAASNYPEIMDTATLRDGRIGEKILFNNPELKEISAMFKNILNKYSNTNFADADIKPIAEKAYEAGLSRACITEAIKRAGCSFYIKHLSDKKLFKSPDIIDRVIDYVVSFFKKQKGNSTIAMKKILERLNDEHKQAFLTELQQGVLDAQRSQKTIDSIRNLQLKKDCSAIDLNKTASKSLHNTYYQTPPAFVATIA